MPISIITNFDINASQPIDSRMTVTNSSAREAIVYKYEGLRTFQIDNQTEYLWKGGTWSTSGDGIYGGSGSLVEDTVIYSGEIGLTAGYRSYKLQLSGKANPSDTVYYSEYFKRNSGFYDWSSVELRKEFTNSSSPNGVAYISFNPLDSRGYGYEGGLEFGTNNIKRFTLTSDGINRFWTPTWSADFLFTGLTGNTIYNFPNKNGTIALLSDINSTPSLTSSYSYFSGTASYAILSGTATNANTAQFAVTASYASNSTNSAFSGTASYANTSNSSNTSTYAAFSGTASYATLSGTGYPIISIPIMIGSVNPDGQQLIVSSAGLADTDFLNVLPSAVSGINPMYLSGYKNENALILLSNSIIDPNSSYSATITHTFRIKIVGEFRGLSSITMLDNLAIGTNPFRINAIKFYTDSYSSGASDYVQFQYNYTKTGVSSDRFQIETDWMVLTPGVVPPLSTAKFISPSYINTTGNKIYAQRLMLYIQRLS